MINLEKVFILSETFSNHNDKVKYPATSFYYHESINTSTFYIYIIYFLAQIIAAILCKIFYYN